MNTRSRRVAAVLLLSGAGLVALAGSAGAHALLRTSTPEANEELSKPPDAVTIVFTEEPEPSLSSIHVFDPAGTPFERTPSPQRVPGDRLALRVAVRGLTKGVYTVTWRVVSRVDGHATAGSFAFGVGTPVTIRSTPVTGLPAPRSPPPSPWEMIGRFGLFIGLIGLIGGAWVGAAAFPKPPRALLDLAAWSLLAGLGGLVSLGVAQGRAATGAGFTVLLKTPLGHALLWRAVALAAAAIALIAARRSTDKARTWLWVAAIAGAGVVYAHVAAGHAAAASPRVAEILAQWVHVVAASAWVGGLAALLLGLRGTHSDEKAAAVRRFSTVAAFMLAVVAATGVVRAFGQLHRWSDLWSSGYGVVVLVKSGLILALAALGAINRYRNVPRTATTFDPLRRFSRVEVGVGVVTLAAAAVLASLAPPAPVSASAVAPAGIVVSGSDFGTSVRVRLSVVPGTAGPNSFEVRITDFDTGQPIGPAKVTLRFTFLDDPRVGQSTLAFTRSRDVYRADGLSLSLAGRWRVAVLIERGAASLEVPLELATRCITRVIPGTPAIYVVDLAGGNTAQGYVDPERAGSTEVHVTFFDKTGNELPVPGVPVMHASSGKRALTRTARRLGPGHFVADATLAAGEWRFDFSATGSGGEALRGCFSETLGP